MPILFCELVFCYSYTNMFMHFLNNGFAVVVTHISSKFSDNVQTTEVVGLSFNEIIVFLGLSFIFIFLAALLFKEKNIDEFAR